MDKRLLIEFTPGIAFWIGNSIDGLFLGAGLAAIATIFAIILRWRWDRRLPWLAITIFAVSMVMLILGLFNDDATFVKISGTVTSVAFAVILAFGLLLRPPMLQQSMGYKLFLTREGWQVMHFTWIGVSLIRAAANEVVWRTTSDDTWVLYSVISDFGWFAVLFVATGVIIHFYWDEDEDEDEDEEEEED
ncbi:septation protein IspZ [Gymnodinialimonas sp. 2305UL16-5]|uniref:inner membrane-spanning protein YciB n=1 Tax=Gymnodinialimonas mytili TaxID=3126503 RepID=UPI0030A3F929